MLNGKASPPKARKPGGEWCLQGRAPCIGHERFHQPAERKSQSRGFYPGPAWSEPDRHCKHRWKGDGQTLSETGVCQSMNNISDAARSLSVFWELPPLKSAGTAVPGVGRPALRPAAGLSRWPGYPAFPRASGREEQPCHGGPSTAHPAPSVLRRPLTWCQRPPGHDGRCWCRSEDVHLENIRHSSVAQDLPVYCFCRLIVNNVFNIPELPLSLPNMTDADHGILISKTSFLREAAVIEARFWISRALVLPTELKYTAAKALLWQAARKPLTLGKDGVWTDGVWLVGSFCWR